MHTMTTGRRPKKHLEGDPLGIAAEVGRTLASSSNLDHNYSDEEREFLTAIDRYKTHYRRPHPTWLEVLAVLRSLGWRRATGSHAAEGDAEGGTQT